MILNVFSKQLALTRIMLRAIETKLLMATGSLGVGYEIGFMSRLIWKGLHVLDFDAREAWMFDHWKINHGGRGLRIFLLFLRMFCI